MVIKTKTITNKYEDVFRALFNDNFIDKYAVLYDRLISIEELAAKCYHETDDYIKNFANHLDDLLYLSETIQGMPCDLMFDFYHRYHILMEYLLSKESITVASSRNNKLFCELFTDIWLLGIPTFSHKYF